MISYIRENKPTDALETLGGYGFKPGLKEPRLKWINEQIKQLKNE